MTGIDAALQAGTEGQIGGISGTVTDANTHAAVSNECVTAYDSNGNEVGFANTDANGQYTISQLAVGSYKVGFYACGGNYSPQFYSGESSLATAAVVAVTAGSTTTGIDAALAPGGQISGTVTDADTHAAVADVCVTVYDSAGNAAGSVTTDAGGQYTLPGLASGSYRVAFDVSFLSCFEAGGTGYYALQYYSDGASLATADPVSVTAGSTTSGINAALQPGGRISGAVTDAGTHAPISGVCVTAYDPSGNAVDYGFTDASGNYTISGLASTGYKIGFDAGNGGCISGGTGSYAVQYYDGQSTLATAGLVPVTGSATTTGIDAALTAQQHTLTVALSPAGTGSGTVSGSGINCPGTCADSYPSGIVVVLTATPAAGSTFTGWSGGGCSGTGSCAVTMSSDQTVTATFATVASHTLTVSIQGAGSGSVTGGGISCPGACASSYPSGTVVALTAAPASGSSFSGWSGGGCSGTGTCVVAIGSDQAVTATFSAIPSPAQNLTVSLAGSGGGSVSGNGITCPSHCSASYPVGTIVRLSASPAPGASFDGWSGGACSGRGACTVTMSSDKAVTATFTAGSGGVSASSTVSSPVLGRRETVSVVSGTVLVRITGTTTFVPLSNAMSIPDGSEVDATKGTAMITAATLRAGQTVSADVTGGRFLIEQDRTPPGETHLILSLPLTGCPRTVLPRGAAAARHRVGPRSRHLWVSENGGSWGTNGRYVSTSVEGTRWLTLDQCTRSEVQVTAGRVRVHDIVRNLTKTVSAGHRYTASRARTRR